MSIFSLDNKVAVITGGSRGLGLYMAEALIEYGASRVYISSRKAKACDEAVKGLNEFAAKNGYKGRAISAPADCSNGKGVEELLAQVSKNETKLDILIANAGASWGESLETHPEEAFDKVMDLNVKGVFISIQKFLPLLEKAGSHEDPSRVLITGSIAGTSTSFPSGAFGYLASKAAVHHLGKFLAVELGPRNITVNTIAPGFFPSKMADGVLKVIGNEMVEANPRRRLGVKRDIVGATIYLLSPAGNYINGVVLPIDGGSSLSNL